MSKELEDLLRRVTELEKKLGKSNLFGANQNTIGSTSADLTLKTSGKVKIQWKNKFIDLIKDGKINVNSKFIYISDEIGTKDGIYVSTDGTNVVLKVDDFSVNLIGEIGTTYVSFLQKQETSSEQKHQALTNIGFLYSSIDDVTEKSLKNGIIYIESEQKLYMVQDGELTEFSIDIPNPYTKQFIIAKNDSDKGAIVIKGDGINNSLAFNNFFICNNSDQAYYSSDYGHVFAINDNTILEVKQEGVFSNLNFTSSMFSSNGATSDNGFRLYTENGHSFLEVDNLIVRNGIPKDTDLYPNYWWVDSNVISQVIDYTLGNTTEDTSEEDYQVQVELKYTNIFAIGDQLYAYVNTAEEIENPSDESAESYLDVTLRTLVQFTVVDILNNSIYLKTNNQEIDYTSLVGSILFKINSQVVLKNSNQGFDIIEATSFEEEQNINNIHTRVGNLEPLNLKIRDNNFEIDPDNTLGIYSQNSIFKNAAYSSDYVLPQDDNSSRFVSTEWIHKLFPKGTILMFNGASSEIPEGWSICNGSNGTPNLIEKFIKAGTSSGVTGGNPNNEVTLTVDNMPTHNHDLLGSATTDTDGGHYHSTSANDGSSTSVTQGEGTSATVAASGSTSILSDYEGSHWHYVDLSSAYTSSEGGSQPFNIEPEYYSLIFIMKIV